MSDPSQRIRGVGIQAEISYYDITERWHRSTFTIIGRRPSDALDDLAMTPQLEVAKVFVSETNSYLLPVLGSPKALEHEARERRKLRHRGRAVVTRLLHRRSGTSGQ